MSQKCFFHVDMDAFYASVEQNDIPELRGKPVIVGGTSNRGVVSACSYEARKFGVHSAMPIFQAKKLCPNGYYVRGRMQRYMQVSNDIMDILHDFSPEVQQISIDEAFLDMTGTELLLGPPESAAAELKHIIKSETGLTISIGIGSSKFIAKLASEHGKPDGLFHVRDGSEIAFMDTLRVKDIWGIGSKAAEMIANKGITSIHQLRDFSESMLKNHFGDATGSYLYSTCRGIDPGIFSAQAKNRSISNEITLTHDSNNKEAITQILFDLCHQVVFRSFSSNVMGKTAFIKFKYSDFSSISARKTFENYLLSSEQLFDVLKNLFFEKWSGNPIRLIGAGIGGLEKRSKPIQNELFATEYDKKRIIEQAVHSINNDGYTLMKASTLLGKREKSHSREKRTKGERSQ